jgi:integrase
VSAPAQVIPYRERSILLPTAGSQLTIRQSFQAFAVSLAGRSRLTQRTYGIGLRRFEAHLRAMGIDPEHDTLDVYDDFTLENFGVWALNVYGAQHKTTVVTYLAGARRYFGFLARRRLLPPGISLEAAREGLRELVGRVPYHGAGVDYTAPVKVLRYVNDLTVLPGPRPEWGHDIRWRTLLRDRALLAVLFSTGARIAEALSLDRAHVDDGNLAEPIIVGKGQKSRVLFLSDGALAAIRAYLAERIDRDPALFVRHETNPRRGSGNLRLGYLGAWKQLNVYAEECGVKLTPHHFRHALATALLNNGACLAEVQDILGHSSPETTKKVYAHYQTSHLRDVMNRFRPTADSL